MQPTVDDRRYGPSFDATLYCSTTLENGKTAGVGVQFVPLVAQAIETYIGAGLGREMPAAANNSFRALATTTETGEPNILGSPGLLRTEFDGPRVARVHAAGHAAGLTLMHWAELDDAVAAKSREGTAAHAHRMSGDYELMTYGQLDDDGAMLLADFDKELERLWRRRRPGRRDLLPNLLGAEETHRMRMQGALLAGAERFRAAVAGYTLAAQDDANSLVDALGPAAGVSMAEAIRLRFSAVEEVLVRQHEGLREEVETVEPAAQAALEDLEEALERSGVLHGYKRQLRTYIECVTKAFNARYAFDLTESALVALTVGHDAAKQLHLKTAELQRSMRAVAGRLLAGAQALEDRRLTPVQELVDRPILRREELRALYQSVIGSAWEGVPEEFDLRLRHELAPLSRWLDVAEEAIATEIVGASLPAFARIAAMSADQALRWRCERSGRLAELALRDLIDLAPVMCRYDRARLPEGGSLNERSFTMIGVPDRDTSFFAGTQQGTLVTTGDRRHIVVLQLKLGFPPSAIWGFDRHRRAFEEVRRLGVVAQDIYPGFPHQLKHAWVASAHGARPVRSQRKRRT